MAIAALQTLRHDVQDWQAEALKRGRELLVATARAGHARILQQQPDSTFVAFGDVPGKSFEFAERLIVFKYSPAQATLLPLILRALADGSPVDSGLYKRSHTVFVDNNPWGGGPIRAGALVFVANPVPYARRLEIGKTDSGRAFLISKPNRLYERTARAFAGRYRTVNIEFGYVSLPEAHIARGRLGRNSGNARRRRGAGRAKGRAVQSPAIFIGRRTGP